MTRFDFERKAEELRRQKAYADAQSERDREASIALAHELTVELIKYISDHGYDVLVAQEESMINLTKRWGGYMGIGVKAGDRFAISLGNDGASGADTIVYGRDSDDLDDEEMMQEVLDWL